MGSLHAEAEAAHHASIVDEAIRVAKIPKSRRAHYIAAMARDPQRTKSALSVLAPGVPTGPCAPAPSRPTSGMFIQDDGDDSGSWLPPIMSACSPLTEETLAVWAKAGVNPPPVDDSHWFPGALPGQVRGI